MEVRGEARDRTMGRLREAGGAKIEILASEIFIGGLGSSHHSQPGYTGCLAELKLVTVVAPPSWQTLKLI